MRSGALITADFALEEGREVFAVPGEITSRLSEGTNALLRLGATPLTAAADVLEALGIAPPEPSPPDVGEVAGRLLERLVGRIYSDSVSEQQKSSEPWPSFLPGEEPLSTMARDASREHGSACPTFLLE